MMDKKLNSGVIMLGVIVSLVLLSLRDAHAVPSLTRQTGFACSACHTVFPELTPFGRHFKLTGYIISKSPKNEQIPVAALVQASYTEAKGLKTKVDPYENSPLAKFNIPQELSVFYAGRIIGNFGSFIQVTYDGVDNDIALDMTDIRYANTTHIENTSLIYGITLNNNPTLEDVWNSTPAFRFPYAESSVAPTPAASTIIDGTLAQQVGGIGAYAFWNDLIYIGGTIYRTTKRGITRPLGAGTEPVMIVDDAVPYWRVVLQHQWKNHSLALGTYGIVAKIYPSGFTSGSTDKFTDTAADAQYQYISKKHVFSATATWIHEKQDWDASFALGNAANKSDDLDAFRMNLNYYYKSSIGQIGGAVGYFTTTGDKDNLLYAPDPVDGSRNGKPNSNGFILEADFLPWENAKFSAQYLIYDKFNGAHSNYDGFSRDASDNNTLFLLVWLMF
jgi:hypothetical protein